MEMRHYIRFLFPLLSYYYEVIYHFEFVFSLIIQNLPSYEILTQGFLQV